MAQHGLLALALLAGPAAAAHWAVIVAGSSGYSNYRHQADACHAYQLMKKKGIPEANIIMMAYDDIAHSFQNPFKGKLFNKPDPDGPGVDVYAGCNIDYKGKDVTPDNFVKVLTGTGQGKVLKSTADDKVFVTFFDHGAPGLIAFPGYLGLASLHKKDLQAALQKMADSKMFKKLVFYLEACESGSMFEDMNITNVYAVSAANAKESSWGAYCGSQAKVNGKNINACLGDLFSINWLEDSDAHDTTKESLATQYQRVKTATNRSHVMQWSDQTFTSDDVSEYIGSQDAELVLTSSADLRARTSSIVSAREADLHRFYSMYSAASTGVERLAAGDQLSKELAKQLAVENAYRKFAEIAYPDDEDQQKAARRRQEKPDYRDCEMDGHGAFREFCADQFDANSGFALQFHQVVVNVCADVARGLNLYVAGAVQQACGHSAVVV